MSGAFHKAPVVRGRVSPMLERSGGVSARVSKGGQIYIVDKWESFAKKN